MFYAKWSDEDEIKKLGKEIDPKNTVEKSGVCITHNKNNLIIDERPAHSLVIGSTGSGKTQTVILPLIKTALRAGESLVVNDSKGELYEYTASAFKEAGYKVITLDFMSSLKGNNWNPLLLPYQMYIGNNKDKSIEALENVGYYLFFDNTTNMDDFWTKSAIDFFTGLCLYLFDNAKESEINLNSVFNLANSFSQSPEKELSKLDKLSSAYYNLSGTLASPKETMGGIVSVFEQKLKLIVSRENLSNMLSTSNFDMTSLYKEKTIVYIISGNSKHANYLVPLFINQIYDFMSVSDNNEKYYNLILESFDEMIPINNFPKLLNYSRGLKIKITLVLANYLSIVRSYGKEYTEILKTCFGNIIYLLSNELTTLEEISKLCGTKLEKNIEVPLISVEELKTMKIFDTIILTPRYNPIRTSLLPDFKIDWGIDFKESKIPERKINKIELFSLK